MFIDKVKIKIAAGNGGNGCASFRREKYVAAGGPDGGDGGNGGNVVFVVDKAFSNLANYKHGNKIYRAGNGEDGKSKKRNGKTGTDLILKVPKGTIIKEAQSQTVIADLTDEEPFIAALGGKGGLGNQHFATSTTQAPKFAKSGKNGEEWELILELKLIADVGLVGFPNVGKSTLISVLTNAKPKIGNYSFTTLSPVLGVVEMDYDHSFVIADIPGLIEGAHEGTGLGDEFLRHIERCRMLIHVVDVSGSEGRDPKDDFYKINEELSKYNKDLIEKTQLVVANKCDIATDEQIKNFNLFIEEQGYECINISAATTEGVKELKLKTFEKVSKLPKPKKFEVSEIPEEYREKQQKENIEITVEGNVYSVEAEFFNKILSYVDFDDFSSLAYLQQVLKEKGVVDELIKKGIKTGDIVMINGVPFDYVP
ncbi:MAG: GTPase ObgE [Clostridia bacterium]|nr:GTPase ObgE [Clostridia bacterium]